MKLTIQRSIIIIFTISLFLVLLFTSIQVVAFNLDYYESQYNKRNIANNVGMKQEELMKVTYNMLEYLKDNRDNLDIHAMVNGEVSEVFGNREKRHMMDVKTLFLTAMSMRNYSLIILCISLLYFLKYKYIGLKALACVKYTYISVLGFITLLCTILLINFNRYFTIFHHIFFSNDLWILNPKEDILINIVPETFFFETAIIILAIFSFTLILIIFIASRVIRKNKIKVVT
jgi:integral membrane protein (TIGR01906 family)